VLLRNVLLLASIAVLVVPARRDALSTSAASRRLARSGPRS
jgi:hypothetical protein